MHEFQIAKTKQYPPGKPADAARIVEIMTSGGSRIAVGDVVSWTDSNIARFWVAHPEKPGVKSWVTTYQLPTGTRHIRTEPNSTKKDNLDSLPLYD